MKISLILICNIMLTLKTLQAINESEETALRKQLLNDVTLLKQETADVKRRVNNQMTGVNNNFDKITGLSNVTMKTHTVLETSQAAAANTLTLLLNTVKAVNDKVQQFEEKIKRLDVLDTKLNSFEVKLDNQLKVLQQTMEKLTTDHAQLANISEELNDFKEINLNFQKTIMRPRRRLPADVLLGLSSANLTTA